MRVRPNTNTDCGQYDRDEDDEPLDGTPFMLEDDSFEDLATPLDDY